MNVLRCILVDDERLPRVALRCALQAHPDVQIVGEADSMKSALAAVQALNPDLIFLDVQMPGGGGFDVLEQLETPPHVIFLTAYDRYALRAFDVNAVDYLLKPIDPDRLSKAVERVRARRQDGAADAQPPSTALDSGDMAMLELGHSGHFLPVSDFSLLVADGNYTRVLDCKGQWRVTQQTLGRWETRLPKNEFLRLDRAHLVRRDAIQKADISRRSGTLWIGSMLYPLALGPTAAVRARSALKR